MRTGETFVTAAFANGLHPELVLAHACPIVLYTLLLTTLSGRRGVVQRGGVRTSRADIYRERPCADGSHKRMASSREMRSVAEARETRQCYRGDDELQLCTIEEHLVNVDRSFVVGVLCFLSKNVPCLQGSQGLSLLGRLGRRESHSRRAEWKGSSRLQDSEDKRGFLRRACAVAHQDG
jgi:hypothetical protein